MCRTSSRTFVYLSYVAHRICLSLSGFAYLSLFASSVAHLVAHFFISDLSHISVAHRIVVSLSRIFLSLVRRRTAQPPLWCLAIRQLVSFARAPGRLIRRVSSSDGAAQSASHSRGRRCRNKIRCSKFDVRSMFDDERLFDDDDDDDCSMNTTTDGQTIQNDICHGAVWHGSPSPIIVAVCSAGEDRPVIQFVLRIDCVCIHFHFSCVADLIVAYHTYRLSQLQIVAVRLLHTLDSCVGLMYRTYIMRHRMCLAECMFAA